MALLNSNNNYIKLEENSTNLLKFKIYSSQQDRENEKQYNAIVLNLLNYLSTKIQSILNDIISVINSYGYKKESEIILKIETILSLYPEIKEQINNYRLCYNDYNELKVYCDFDHIENFPDISNIISLCSQNLSCQESEVIDIIKKAYPRNITKGQVNIEINTKKLDLATIYEKTKEKKTFGETTDV